MGFILNLPSSPAAVGFPDHRQRYASRWCGGSRFAGGNAQPGLSARPSSVAASCPPLSRTGSKRTGSVEPKVSQSEAEGSQTSSRRFIWSKHRTKFLTSYLMQQASDGKGKDALFKEDTLREVAEAVSQKFQRECCVADVKRRLTALREKWRSVDRIKALGSAALDHSKDSGLVNRPIQDYDELSFIFGDEYDPSAAEIQLEGDQNTRSDDSKISEHPMEQNISNEDIRYLILKIGELIDAVKSLKPRDFAEDLWKAVSACSYNERMSITAFEYFLKNEVEGKIFLVCSPDLRKEWLAKFFSSLL